MHLLAFACLLALSACSAVSRTPPLSRPEATGGPVFESIYLTSGSFQRSHKPIGVVQMTLDGYRWLDPELSIGSRDEEIVIGGKLGAVELGGDPNGILYKVAALARDNGAEGIQHLVLLDTKPQTRGERVSKQIDTTIKVIEQLEDGDFPTALAEGTKTRYFVKGELVVFHGPEGGE